MSVKIEEITVEHVMVLENAARKLSTVGDSKERKALKETNENLMFSELVSKLFEGG